MKMKMSAVGELSVAPIERQYICLQLPQGEKWKGQSEAAVFVCKAWDGGEVGG